MFSREPAPPGKDTRGPGEAVSVLRPVCLPPRFAGPSRTPASCSCLAPNSAAPPIRPPQGHHGALRRQGSVPTLAFVRLPDAHGDGGGELVLPEGTRRSQSVHSASRPWLEGEGLSRPPLLSGGLGAAAGRGGGRHAHLGPQPRGSPGRAPRSHLSSSRLSRRLTYEDLVHFLIPLWLVSVCWHQARSKVPRVPQ